MSNIVLQQLPQALLPWYQANKRILPWRMDCDPYHIWVSEIMLQQTRVEAVKGYYTRFLSALPTIHDLSNCEDEVLHKLWEGLGYYSRVRNLKKAAEVICRDFDGKFPQNYTQILALPGIGEYTAGAICSIAFNFPTPAVDGNVLRLISRLTNDSSPIDDPRTKAHVRNLLAEIYPKDAGSFTQALMELGATVCGPNRKPDCEHCPCSSFCQGHLLGTADSLPVKSPKKGKRQEDKTVFIFSCGDLFALEKRPPSGLLASLWQFPNVDGKADTTSALEIARQMGLQPTQIYRHTERKHIFTHIQWNMRGFYLEVKAPTDNLEWFTAEEIETNAALPTAFRLFWEEANV